MVRAIEQCSSSQGTCLDSSILDDPPVPPGMVSDHCQV